MEFMNIILSEVSEVQNAKATCFLSYVEYRTQIQEYYEKQVTLRGGHIQEGEGKRRKLRSEYG
jgi:small nuclear ribonucleoprotein (snRNP)-like protein